MKTNPYKKLLKGYAAAGILLDVANHGTLDFQTFASELDGNEITQVGVITSRQIRQSGVEAVLIIGFLLDLYRQLTDQEKELYKNMLADCDIGRTQSYRSINVWRKLGARLAKSPKLLRKFIPEGLKMLCEAKVPDAARDEAISLASKGERITIKVAAEICARHGVAMEGDRRVVTTALPSKNTPPILDETAVKELAEEKPATETPAVEEQAAEVVPKVRRSILSFAGTAFRFVVETKTPKLKEISTPVLAAVIADAKRFLTDLENQYDAMTNSGKLPKEE